MHNHNPVWSSDGEWIYFVHGFGSDDRDGRLAHSTGRRNAGTTDRSESPFELPGGTRPAHAALRVAHGDPAGPWLWAVDVERKVTRR